MGPAKSWQQLTLAAAPPFLHYLTPGHGQVSAGGLRRCGLPVSDDASFQVTANSLAATGASVITAHRVPLGPRGAPLFEHCYAWATVAAESSWQDLLHAGRRQWGQEYLVHACPYLALALHHRHGWPIQGLIQRNPAAEHLRTVHLWTLDAAGQAVDIEGRQPVSRMLARYADLGFPVAGHTRHEPLEPADVLGFFGPPLRLGQEPPWQSPHQWDVTYAAEALWLAAQVDDWAPLPRLRDELENGPQTEAWAPRP